MNVGILVDPLVRPLVTPCVDWVGDPLAAFQAHVVSPEFRATALRKSKAVALSRESMRVYGWMFSAFVSFMRERGLSVYTVGAPEIYAFLTARTAATESVPSRLVLSSAIQTRYLRLLERVFVHLQRVPNPTSDLLFGPMRDFYALVGRNQKTVVLNPREARQFLAGLPCPTAVERVGRATANWRKRRDRALQCVLMGSGLTVAEVIGLSLSEVSRTLELDGSLCFTLRMVQVDDRSAKQATFTPHTTFLQASFVEDVLAWIKEREAMVIPGSLMFPNAKGMAMSKASIYRQIRQSFARSQMDKPRMGGRTLRNTFAIEELNRGTEVALLKKKLGLFEDRSMAIYAKAART